MALKIKLPKIKLSKITNSMSYFYILMVLIALAAFSFVGYFLYKNLYLTVTQSEEIIILKKEVAPDVIDIDRVNTVLQNLEEKAAGADDLDWSNIKNPFAFSASEEIKPKSEVDEKEPIEPAEPPEEPPEEE